jgi:hypothetical protein
VTNQQQALDYLQGNVPNLGAVFVHEETRL